MNATPAVDASFEVLVGGRRRPFRLAVELRLDQGVLVLFGPSGSGKSLTLQALAGLIRPTRGRIVIGAKLVGSMVGLSVADNGEGIPEESLDSVFEPFYTTREAGKGTGLGLPICERIATTLGGTITLKSELGAGTVVTVLVPVFGSEVVSNGDGC